MAAGDTRMERGLRRKMLMLAVGIKPKDLQAVTSAGSDAALKVKVSGIVNGAGSLPRDEAARLAGLILPRVQQLFERDQER